MSNIKIMSGFMGGRIIKTIRNKNLKPTPARVREQIFSWLRPIKKNSIYIDNTTASATIARELYKNAKAHGFGFLDAPVSGGQAGAENAALTIMAGGDKDSYEKACETMAHYY